MKWRLRIIEEIHSPASVLLWLSNPTLEVDV